MAIRPILIHPDPRLKKVAETVDSVDDSTRALIDDMFDTMYDAPGIGLAAPQIGVLKRILVMDCGPRDEGLDEGATPTPDPVAMINPEVLSVSDDKATAQEGCLSIPDMFEDVTRPSAITVRFLDRDGALQEQALEGIRAVCVQHEIDHLNGRLFIDHLGPVKRSMITAKMKKLKRERAREKAETGSK